MKTRNRLNNLIWPLLLIAAGLILLLNNTGVIETDLFGLISLLWPVLLIIWAVQMWLGSRMIFMPLLFFLAGVGFLLDNFGIGDWNVWETMMKFWPLIFVALGLDVLVGSRRFKGDEREESFTQPLDGATSARVTVEPGLGNAVFESAITTDALVVASTTVGSDQEVGHSYRRSGDEAIVKIKREGEWMSFLSGSWLGRRNWQIALNPTIPTRLKIEGGLGSRKIDLSKLNLSELKVEGGMGALTLTFPETGALSAKVDTGFGDATLFIPASMAVRIDIDGGLGRRQVQGGFLQVGNNLMSPNYDQAMNRMDLKIDHGLGGLTIAQI
ncbi:MAG: hypothetical protein J5I90_16470 [Caldilineales bacterium]|nr:hypothetical protein [Caldilineales bacterium]